MRRARLFPTAVFALVLPVVSATLLAAQTEFPQAVGTVHADIWDRFVLPAQGLVLDYSLEGDFSLLPDAAETVAGKPNALSWWTPLENGAFFSGLYLDAMVRRFQLTGLAADRDKAARLAQGLLLCASVGSTPGFVARGVMPDGKSHYAIGSDDQTSPWFYGLWRFVSSGMATPEEKAVIVAKMNEVATAIRQNHWEMPCDPVGDFPKGQSRGGWSGSDYRSASRLLFVTKAMAVLTGDAAWKEAYEQVLREDLGNGKTRLDVVAQGIPGEWQQHPQLADDHIYIYVVSQAMVAELLALEARPEISARLIESLKVSAAACSGRISADTSRIGSKPFRKDWRTMNGMWKPQKTPIEAADLALVQLTAWANEGRIIGAQVLREPFCAAWIAVLSPDAPRREILAQLERSFEAVAWDRVSSSAGFFGESAWYAGMLAETHRADAKP